MKPVMCVLAVAVVVAALMAAAAAVPLPLEDQEQAVELAAPAVEGRADRHRRVTCDLMSFQSKWVTPNHAACAAHCIALLKGYKGGRCENAVCVCRK